MVELLQADASRYPFHAQPPAFVRAHLYKYWFTEPKEDGCVSPSSVTVSLHCVVKLGFLLYGTINIFMKNVNKTCFHDVLITDYLLLHGSVVLVIQGYSEGL